MAALTAVTAAPAPAATTPGPFGPVKSYLLRHTAQLEGFTKDFRAVADRYYATARESGFAYGRLARDPAVRRDLARARALWVKGNPYYERVEGIVAGTPSLAVYDVILDAGSSAEEDPASAVPFDLRLPNGKVLHKPGNLFNLTEGMLWGTLPSLVAARPDLDRDGRREFGEALPDAHALKAAAGAFAFYADKLDRSARAWRPTASDAFTAVVVMVPTMSEYFGQWKTSRFVLGEKASSQSFNVVSRLSDIGDILGGLRVIFTGIRPSIVKVSAAQAAQTKRDLDSLHAYVSRLLAHERAGRRFTPQQADILGREAQERATAIAGQVSQAAARLKVKIVQ
ncbi:MAG TPA: imelysin family protein [Gaiella sp.]|uniref:imelysin family protein n=1 Tax=Gaiella sp. TaxID=2663207 RepID=UPI002D80BAEB|nr:imelysin family protein [Gaiella sp.]HET9287028.1 imelysin family protein [Gaiella sp.]